MLVKAIKKIAAVAFWIAIWQLLAIIINKPLLVPSPVSVLLRLAGLCLTTDFWLSVSLSFVRITAGIAMSLIIGTILGIVTAKSEFVNLLVSPILSLVKATPVASFIMLALLWLDRDSLPIFITVLIVVPVVCSNVFAGIKSVDKSLVEVTQVFKFSFWKTLRRLYIPSVYPYFMSACRSSLGLAWKAGIAAEVLAVPALSIGKMIYDSKLYLETTDLFAWSAVVIVLSVIIEFVFCSALRKLGKNFERGKKDNAKTE